MKFINPDISILNNKKLYIFDMDGTIYLGNRVFPFAIRFIKNLRKNGKKVLVSNSRGGYNRNAENIPTKWLTAKYMKKKFANDTPGLIVRLNYSLSKKTKNRVNNFYSSMGTKWTRQNTSERIPQI